MRFDIVGREGEENEMSFELTDDLQFLGEQLQDDAARLASVYPAQDGPRPLRAKASKHSSKNHQRVSRAAHRRSRLINAATVASMLLLVAAPLALLLKSSAERSPTLGSHDRAATHQPQDVSLADSGIESANDAARVLPISTSTMLLTSPAVLGDNQNVLRHASGPQAEALIDYMELTETTNVQFAF